MSRNLLKEFKNFVSKYRIIMFIDESLEPVFVVERGECRYKVAIISLPKAGTYLLAELLKSLGLVSTGLHVTADGSGFTDYRFISLEKGRRNYRNYVYKMPFDEVVERVRPCQFVVGHFHYNDYIKRCLQDFKKIFIVRELRHCLISHMRFLKDTGREDLSHFTWHKEQDKKNMMVAYLREFGRIFSDTWAFPLMGWMKCDDVLVLRFEEILEMEEMPEGILTKLGRFLGLGDRKIDPDKFLFRGTLTWSGKLSSLDEYWSEEAENYFRQLGLYEVNTYFGY